MSNQFPHNSVVLFPKNNCFPLCERVRAFHQRCLLMKMHLDLELQNSTSTELMAPWGIVFAPLSLGRRNVWGREDRSSPYFGILANPILISALQWGGERLYPPYKVGPTNIFDIPSALSAPLLHFFLGWSIKSLSDIQRQEQQFSDDDDKENKFHMSKKWQCLTFFATSCGGAAVRTGWLTAVLLTLLFKSHWHWSVLVLKWSFYGLCSGNYIFS